MGSSSWSSASVYDTAEGGNFFVKETRGHGVGMFEGEALGLQAMHGEMDRPTVSSTDPQLELLA